MRRSGRTGHRVSILGLASAIVLASVGGMGSAEVAVGAQHHSIRAWLDNSCIGGKAPPGSVLWATWKDAEGTIKQKGTVRTSKHGMWSLCDSGQVVRAGDRLSAKLGTNKRNATVPPMDMEIDRDADIIRGRTKANQALTIYHCYWRPDYHDTNCDYRLATSDAEGRFSASMWGVGNDGDIRGGDRLDMVIGAPSSNMFGLAQFAPYVDVLLGDTELHGAYVPRAPLTVQLLDTGRGEKAEWSGTASRTVRVWSGLYGGTIRVGGIFAGRFEPVSQGVSVGDLVTSAALPPISGLPILDIDLSADAATDVIAGSCTDKTRYELVVRSPGGTEYLLPMAMTTGRAGSFTRDLTGKFDLKRGSIVRLTCQFWTGDRLSELAVAG